jgi:hypothetical protein
MAQIPCKGAPGLPAWHSVTVKRGGSVASLSRPRFRSLRPFPKPGLLLNHQPHTAHGGVLRDCPEDGFGRAENPFDGIVGWP